MQNGLVKEENVHRTIAACLEDGRRNPRSLPQRKLPSYRPEKEQSFSNVGNQASGSTAPPGDSLPSFHTTDLGNAERFVIQHGDYVRWCSVWKSWMIFNGKFWERDRSGKAEQCAIATVRAIFHEAATESDDEKRKQIAKHAMYSESGKAIHALLYLAKHCLSAEPEQFNTARSLINCNNGTLDLRTGDLHPHASEDMLTRCLAINYTPHAPCPKWLAFLTTIFAQNQELIDFLQQALGMSLSGDISEQCLFICYGDGLNGKTTLLETIRIILGPYGLAANIETFQLRRADRITHDVADLYGARFVTASECPQGSRLNEAFVKKVSGNEPLRARRLHENDVEFLPECTIWLAVNHKPDVRDTSLGMWRRVYLIPFQVTIDKKQIDKHLGEKLVEEAEGVLAWLVQGCRAWYRQGHLVVPHIVTDATAAYREEMNTAARFIKEECELRQDRKISAKTLLTRYEMWCEEHGEHYEVKPLRAELLRRGLHSNKSIGGFYYWFGIGLKDNLALTGNETL